jgi:hypothetical protein
MSRSRDHVTTTEGRFSEPAHAVPPDNQRRSLIVALVLVLMLVSIVS